MRSGPIGYLKSPHEILEAAHIQASVTHNTPGGIMSSQAIALMYHYLIYNKGSKENLGAYIENWLPDFKWSSEFTGTVPIEGIGAAHAAISTVQRCLSLQEVLLRAVNYGGDTDTAAAMSLGAASCSNEILKDLPVHLYDDLENGTYGRDYLKILEYRLNALYRPE
jgi:ADP-ribosylglycohydrolase